MDWSKTFILHSEVNREIVGIVLYYYRSSLGKERLTFRRFSSQRKMRGTGLGYRSRNYKQGKKTKYAEEWNVLDWNTSCN
jgi:hypothetical protein